MIRHLEIKNYKCYNSLTLPQISRVTLVGGANNVGKTALLEALFLFHDRLAPNATIRHIAWRGVTSVELRPGAFFAPMFHGFDLNSPIEIEVVTDSGSARLQVRFDEAYRPSTLPAQDRAAPQAPASVRADQTPASSSAVELRWEAPDVDPSISHLVLTADSSRLEIGSMVLGAPVARYLSARGFVDATEVAAMFGQLDVERRTYMVERFLQVLEPTLSALSVVPVAGVPVVHADVGLARKVPVAYIGSGMSRLLEIAVSIGTSRDGLVLIDEIENGIHHTALKPVWQAILGAACECNCQVVATTHSYECVRALHAAGIGHGHGDDLTYLRLERGAGGVVAKQFDFTTLGFALDGNMEVR
jgi:hypothetical protein